MECYDEALSAQSHCKSKPEVEHKFVRLCVHDM